LAVLNRFVEDFRRLNTRIFPLSVDRPEHAALLVRELELQFEILSDPGAAVIRLYGRVHQHETRGEIAFPSVFIIQPDGEIIFRALDQKAYRTTPQHLLEFLEAFAQNPGLRQEGSERRWVRPNVRQELRNWGVLPNPYDEIGDSGEEQSD
jgi:peroxiredoxin